MPKYKQVELQVCLSKEKSRVEIYIREPFV
jgi:hypothetical protein